MTILTSVQANRAQSQLVTMLNLPSQETAPLSEQEVQLLFQIYDLDTNGTFERSEVTVMHTLAQLF